MARSQHLLGPGAVEPGRAYSADHGDSERMGRGHRMVLVEFVVVGDVWFEFVLNSADFDTNAKPGLVQELRTHFHGDQEVGWWGWPAPAGCLPGCLKATDGCDGRRWESGAGSAAAAYAVRRVSDATSASAPLRPAWFDSTAPVLASARSVSGKKDLEIDRRRLPRHSSVGSCTRGCVTPRDMGLLISHQMADPKSTTRQC